MVDPVEVEASLDDLEAALTRVAELGVDVLSIAPRLDAMSRLEAVQRRVTALSHQTALSIAKEDESVLGDAAHRVIADRLRISVAEARRRIRDAGQLAPRPTLIGPMLAPELPATAAQWQAGVLDGEHLRVIQRFFSEVAGHVDAGQREACEEFLADKAAELRPDQLRRVADRLAIQVNPDGRFSDDDRARKRGFTWSGQGPDGMSEGRLTATPELRANLEAWFAKYAAPGMCNPADQSPVVDGEPAEPDVDKDFRTMAQRQHDALNALVRSQLGNPTLGVHNGLPVSVIVSTTLRDLEAASGYGVTGGGTLVPMRDLIRMASHAYHYLAVFDEHKERRVYLGRAERIASADQRIVLHARDRGCTRPGCTSPGYYCEVHHVLEWVADHGETNVDTLTFGCGPDHGLVKPRGWKTSKRADERIEWIPPPQTGQPPGVNDFHHPERYLSDGQDDVDDPPTTIVP